MKTALQIGYLLLMSLLVSNNVLAQTKKKDFAKDTIDRSVEKGWIYLGAGYGADYGGWGLKVEYLLLKQLGLHAAVGYTPVSMGFSVGAAFKCLPNEQICPNILAMFGSNTVLSGTEGYDMVSYGPSVGASLDYSVGKRNHKITMALLYAIRSNKFMDNYNNARNNLQMKTKEDITPIILSLGINFHL